MRLSSFSDYSLRVLAYLGVNADRLVTIAEVAQAYAISENHLMKVVHHLGRAGYLETVRGKGGGIRLAKAPEDIVIGEVVRQTESDLALVECFGNECCRIASVCRLKSILQESLEAMFLVLDGYTLADVLDTPLDRLIRTIP
ncbi:MAG: Rrf2 family transcriptional regulator [Rhodocyclaceae bacterium]|nr:Rrf2 family transcriptional regulator [Rhodocyclaceae bacterium]